jgi:hypothetical protein
MSGDAMAQNLPVLGDTAREELSPLMESVLVSKLCTLSGVILITLKTGQYLNT